MNLDKKIKELYNYLIILGSVAKQYKTGMSNF